MTKRQDALDYHSNGRPGKIAVVPTKPLTNQRDLSLAYSPGVAEPCLEIEKDNDLAYTYTAKGNLVGVVTNGTAVLGLGNIGAIAGKPVMEGKANLFKQFADLDVFDLEVGSENPDDVIKFCQLLEPTVGSRSWQNFMTSSACSDPTSRSKTSRSANCLKRLPLPSMTGLPASAPMLPSPRTAVPLVTTATRLPRAV